jgi:hypothetical protein
MASNKVKLAQVRIYATDGQTVVGSGFLVKGREVLTCAHVVTLALGQPDDTPKPPSDQVSLDFPFLGPGQHLTARVARWHPQDDIAVLELESARPLAPNRLRWWRAATSGVTLSAPSASRPGIRRASGPAALCAAPPPAAGSRLRTPKRPATECSRASAARRSGTTTWAAWWGWSPPPSVTPRCGPRSSSPRLSSQSLPRC